ncbi:MAG: FG-GAP repeat domain-containing protein, partial [Thermoanaerobaculia bacterium]
PYSIAVGDFNGDGKPDLATANTGDGVSILLGNGDGTVQAAVNYGVGTAPLSVAVADFNGDGKADLGIANFSSGNVSILLGNGNGTFQPVVNYGAGSGPRFLAAGDFNGDGKPDLAVANQNSNDLSVLLATSSSIRAQMQAVLNDLKALRGTVTGDAARDLEQAIKHLSKSLDAGLWLNEFHLQPKKGKKVFNEDKHVVERLGELIEDCGGAIPEATLQGLIDRLVAADGQLASLAIADATAAGLDSRKIAKAQKEMRRAARDIAGERFGAAIEHYQRAWEIVQLSGEEEEDD